ncbi:gliding motility-associated C-terminal domain-containing protein [Mucilaginibacter sp. OAE612]|uniref:T9SS type B sorting domain-containing protein n=1 Tax=Mucilaginibacter sp. OAE612 TaxID=3156444 RepID=UPI0035A0D432
MFNRYGKNVFNSIGYSHPFNGTYNGKPLPAGSYYYIINLSSGCGLLSGSLSIIR